MLDKLKHWLAGDALQVRAKVKPRSPRAPAPGAVQRERACPHCGEPMLASWGSTCGSCRPGMAAPTSVNLSRVVHANEAPGLALGWLVVVQSPDPRRQGTLIELDAPIVVLSRGVRPTVGQAWLDFADEFMSCGHAQVFRPERDEPDGGFCIRDRSDPGPSANGSFVNSLRLRAGESVRLSEGDVVRVGLTELVFKSLWLPPGTARSE